MRRLITHAFLLKCEIMYECIYFCIYIDIHDILFTNHMPVYADALFFLKHIIHQDRSLCIVAGWFETSATWTALKHWERNDVKIADRIIKHDHLGQDVAIEMKGWLVDGSHRTWGILIPKEEPGFHCHLLHKWRKSSASRWPHHLIPQSCHWFGKGWLAA